MSLKINKYTPAIVINLIVFVFLGVFLCLASFTVVYLSMKAAPQENVMRLKQTVKEICDRSRDVQSGAYEDACGVAQDSSDTEYLCKGPSVPNSQCFVEDHHYDK